MRDNDLGRLKTFNNLTHDCSHFGYLGVTPPSNSHTPHSIYRTSVTRTSASLKIDAKY